MSARPHSGIETHTEGMNRMTAMNDQVFGNMKKLMVLAAMAAVAMCTAAHAVTPGDVQTSCARCHGLTVNGVVVSAGPGTNGFTSHVSGRDQATWVNTIGRMQGYGATVSDVNGTAAYLAGLGAQPGAPINTPTVTPTGTPPQDATATPAGKRPRPRRTRRPMRTSTPTPTPTATPNPVSGNSSGAAAYGVYCARCHEPASPGFVGQTVYGASAGDIAEAIAEVRQMQFLQTLVTRQTMTAIVAYLRSVNPGGGGDGGGGDGGGGD
jgi:mono/diheme cytochrome c family protein